MTALSLFLVVAFGIGAFLWFFSRDDGLIYDNVYALGVDLSGKTQEEAQLLIAEKAQEVYNRELTIQLQDRSIVLTPQDASVSVDAAAIAQTAYDYGRDGNMFQRARARSQATLTSLTLDVKDYMTVDNANIRAMIENLGADVESTLMQPTIVMEGSMPDLNKYILKEEVKVEDYDPENYRGKDNEFPEGTKVIDPESDDLTLKDGLVMVINNGTPGRHLDTEDLYAKVMEAYNTGSVETIEVQYDEVLPDVLNATELFTKYCTAPVDSVMDEEEYVASLETLGYGFDPGTVQSLINGHEGDEPLNVTFELLVPQTTKYELEKDLFCDILAQEKTTHTYNSNRTNNLRLACKAIDGYILKPGAQFSFNDVVGVRSEAKGYKEAAVYSGGKTKQELGGGVCQVATTLYVCTLLSDLQVDERAVHSYVVSYEPEGLDATVYYGYLDYKFTNNTEYPIRIDASVHDGVVDIAFVGTETKDYYVKMRTVVTSRTPWETKEVVVTDGSYKDGETITTPYTGCTADSYKQKWDRATDTMISEEFEAHSSYSKRDKEVAVVPQKPTPTTEPTTDGD